MILLGIIIWTACDDNGQEVFVGPEGMISQFTDTRDGKVYQCVTIGKQTWMAENLAYRMPLGSVNGCYTYQENSVDTTKLSEMDIDKAFAEKFKNSQELIQGTVNVILPWGDVFTMPIFEYIMSNSLGGRPQELIQVIQILLPQMAESSPDVPRALEILDSLHASIKPELIASLVSTQLELAEINNEGYAAEYGYLYTWPAAQKALPEGWRLPTDEDWKILEKELGMEETELNLLEEWRNKGVETLLKNEQTGFRLKYGGLRAYGNFGDHGTPYINKNMCAAFWTSTSINRNDSTQVAIVRTVSLINNGVLRSTANTVSGNFAAAYSIRGIKNN